MTDITELAQREKFEAWFKSSFHPDKTGPYIKDQLYFAWKAASAELVEALESEKRICATWRKTAEANSEKLEKAQQVDEELCKLLPLGAEYMDPPDGGDVTPLEGVRRMVADYRQRIAELECQLKSAENNEIDARCHIADRESRTVTINTPDARDEDYDWDGQTPSEAFNTCRMICALMFRQSLRAAGIKVEAE